MTEKKDSTTEQASAPDGGNRAAAPGAAPAESSVEPGIHTMSAERYHADPCPEPSLSASLAAVLIGSTPLHAWAAHPRLNPGFAREEKQEFDIGNVAHELVLEGSTERVVVIEAESWRGKDAREARDEARALDLIPLLAKDYARVEAAVSAIRTQLMARNDDPPLFADGVAEPVLVWREGDVWLRARLDWLHHDFSAIDDLKTTGRTANPTVWGTRTLWSVGGDIQVALYRRGLKALTGKDAEFRYVVAESTPPFALSVVGLAPSALELGEAKAERAIELWRKCIRSGDWPAYPSGIYYAESPAWAETQWMEQDAEVVLV